MGLLRVGLRGVGGLVVGAEFMNASLEPENL